MSTSTFLASLQAGLSLVETLAPIAGTVGGPKLQGVVKLAGALGEIAQDAAERAAEAKTVFSTTDQAEIRRITEALAARNDALAAKVAES